MRLRKKCRRLQPPVLAFSHHALHVLSGQFQILQQHALKLVGSIRVFGNLPHPVQRRGDVAVPDRLAKRGRSSKIAVRQLFNLPHAELVIGDGNDEVFNVAFPDAVHAHELA